MSRDIDFTQSNLTGSTKILRPLSFSQRRSNNQMHNNIKKQMEENKTKTFDIVKSFTPDNTSQIYKKHILPNLHEIKKLQTEKKKQDIKKQKLLEESLLVKEEIAQNDNKGNQDIQKDIVIDKEGKTRDLRGNLVLIQNDLFSTVINKNINKKEQIKQLQKKKQKKTHDRVQKAGFHDNNIAGSTKTRVRRTLAGLQFEEDQDQYMKQQEQNAVLPDDLGSFLAPKTQRVVKKLKKTKRTKLQTQQLIPEKQWWDSQFVTSTGYFALPSENLSVQEIIKYHETNINSMNIEKAKQIINFQQITGNVSQFELFPGQQQKPITMPVFLTEDERKKLKRMRKRQKLRQKNDKIKLGLLEPDKPKLKLTNMALVMKEQYILDPSRVQLQVRKQIQGRLDTHLQTNQSRKLTKQKKAEKSLRKLKRDSAKETRVAVFRIDQVKDRTHRFKIEMNAKQLALNGLFLYPGDKYKGPAVIVAEGGRRAIKFYKNLLLNRINWSEIDSANLVSKEEEGQEVLHQKMTIRNKCYLVWQAVVTENLFSKWRAVQINNDSEAIRVLAQRKAQHFWDMILNFQQQR